MVSGGWARFLDLLFTKITTSFASSTSLGRSRSPSPLLVMVPPQTPCADRDASKYTVVALSSRASFVMSICRVVLRRVIRFPAILRALLSAWVSFCFRRTISWLRFRLSILEVLRLVVWLSFPTYFFCLGPSPVFVLFGVFA
ncbi:unnamed protein product [Ectocarpus sp. 4 AP-2014]